MTVGAEKISIKKFPHMLVNQHYVSFLESHNLLDFDRIYHFQGPVIKQRKERTVMRSVVPMEFCSESEKRTFYLKRHAPLDTVLRGRIVPFFEKRFSPGVSEFEYICAFREHGIPTVSPVAAGEREISANQYESFLVTDSFEPYIPLEDIIRIFPDDLRGKAGEIKKRNLIQQASLMARQIHEAGFNHCDFNATHVLVSPFDEKGLFSLATFDLQRIDRKKWLRWKWFIKVMAEMSYTLPAPLFTEEDWLFLYQTYKGSQRLNMWDRFELNIIKRKRKKISKHTDKIAARQIQQKP
ncbi:MAG: lipopolysaccharide kinase InaA family protein [Syntrophobacterales bacterium]|nr:lipopolysaccharide kinase InaA family protein [Syntrophobacterales bacterium]